MDKGYPVHLANTLAIQQYNSIKYTNDATDARCLAHLLRLKILPTGYIYPKALRHYATCYAAACYWCSNARHNF